MKPGDYFIGIIDFFSTMVPGTIASYIVMAAFKNDVPDWWIETEFGSIEGWAVFLVSSYALGQLLAAVGTMLLDPPFEGMRKGRMKTGRGWTILSAIKGARWNTVSTLESAAKATIEDQIRRQSRSAESLVGSLEPFWWTLAQMRLQTPIAAEQIDRLTAQAKFFRSLTLIALLATIPAGCYYGRSLASGLLVLGLGLVAILSWFRFCRLRWGERVRAFEYFLAVDGTQ